MIVLYIFLGIIVFFLLFLASIIFIPFKMVAKGTYWDKNPTGQMDVYWIKYFLGARVRIKDLEFIHILVWFLGIPLPIKFPLSNKKIENEQKDSKKGKKKENEEIPEVDEKTPDEPKKKKSLKEHILTIVSAKDTVNELWLKYKDYIKKIFVSYITFSLEYIHAELGLKDPAQTGIVAGIVYSTLSLKPLENIKVSWNYQKPNFNISGGIKMTMNLYGILRTLLSLYFRYKKDKKNEV
jgi:hypothetical protein